MATIDNGRRVVDQDKSLVIFPEDSILIDSATNGTRQITYEDLCLSVAKTLGIDTIKSTADGAMQKSVYDKNGNGTVDDSSALEGHAANYFATADSVKDVKKTADGAMQQTKYDANGNGIVDNAEKVNTHTVEEDVPQGAVFTDTIYDDTQVKKDIKQNSDDIQKLQGGIGLSVVDGKIKQTVVV